MFIASFVLLSLLIFSLSYLSRGSAIFANFPQNVSTIEKIRIEASMGLDRSFMSQYISTMKGVLSLKARSLVSGELLIDILPKRIEHTFALALFSFVLLIILSISLALLCLYTNNVVVSFLVNLFSFTFFSLPVFVTALLLIMVFTIYLGIFPIYEHKSLLAAMALPASVIVLTHLASYMRYSLSIISDSLKADFIASAYARGLSKARIFCHFALKASMPPIISYFGVNFISIFMSAFVVEAIFSYEGIGQLGIKSIINKDFPLIMAIALCSVVIVFIFKLLSALASYLLANRW